MSLGTSTLSEKGQITIPKEIREYLGLRAGDKVLFLVEEDRVVLVKAGAKRVADVLRKQKPWKTGYMEFQQRLRGEWE